MTSQNIALWALINTQSKGGYSKRKKGRYRKLITITFDWIGIFWWGFQQNNSLKAFYQHPENQEYFKFLYICPLSHYENTPIQIYWKFYHQKKWKFSDKNSDIFHISAQNIDCGYSLEPPRRGGSNEYPQSMFLSRNKKNNVYPCKPQFYYIKVGFKGVKII